MPTNRTRSRSKFLARPASRRPSLLVLHLDAAKLRVDGLHLGDAARFSAVMATLAYRCRVEVRDATDVASLLALQAEFVVQKRRFDAIVVIGHSNANGIRVASNYFARWGLFASWLRPLSPRRLVLVACGAGQSEPGNELFARNPNLRDIFACPVKATKDFGTLMLLGVPHLVGEQRLDRDDILLAQWITVGLTGCQLRVWRRGRDYRNPENALLDFVATQAEPLARQIPAAINSLFR